MQVRYPAFDGLRALCFSFIIAWHGLLPFTSRARGVKADLSSPQIDVLAWLLRGFAIKELLLVAGFFAHYSLLRYGWRGYLRHRLVRLAVPCLVAMIGYNGLLHWRWAQSLNLSLSQVIHHHVNQGHYYEVFSPMHMWFLVDLMIMTCLVLPLHHLYQRALAAPTQARLSRLLGQVLASPGGLLALALPTSLLLLAHSPQWPGITPGQVIPATPSYPVLTAFGPNFLFFLCGWALYTQPHLLPLLGQRWKGRLAAALIMRALYYGLVFHGPRSAALLPLAAVLEALYWWAIVLGMLGAFQANLVKDRPLWRYAADAGYWCYLTHLFFMAELQLAVNGRGWPIVAQYLVVQAGTWLLLFLTYHYLVRYTGLGGWLHGRRYRGGSSN